MIGVFVDRDCTLTAGINFDGQKKSEKGRIFLVYICELFKIWSLYYRYCRNVS